jgi:hypothetical protein
MADQMSGQSAGGTGRFGRLGIACLAAMAGVLACMSAGVASAQSGGPVPVAEDFETARGMGMGLGVRASAASTAALEYNPANLALARIYHIETFAGYRPQSTRFDFGGALVDSFSSPVAMGVSYRYILGNGRDGQAGMDGRVALAVPIGDAFSIGVAGRYLSFTREGQRPEGDTRGPYAEGVTMDVGLRVTPVAGLHIAAVGQNLIDFGSPLVPRLVGGGISYTVDSMFTIGVDGFSDLSTFHNVDGTLRPEALFGLGAELFTGEVPIRLGYYYDTGRGLHVLSAGLGYVNSSFGIELSYRQQFIGSTDSWLLLSFRYFIH